ncbi:hypothetical protein Bhyg_05100, partial [Pseudolycoriella hygida]
ISRSVHSRLNGRTEKTLSTSLKSFGLIQYLHQIISVILAWGCNHRTLFLMQSSCCKSADLFTTRNMNIKLITVFVFISQIFSVATQETTPKQFAISQLQSVFECDANILSFMSFRYNHKCVQFVRGNENLNSLKSIVQAFAFDSNSTAVLFAFSKLYFIFEDRTFALNKSDMEKLSRFLYEKAHFGYVFELNSLRKKMALRDLLTLQLTESKRKQQNLVHPFVDRRNRKKQFRVRLNNCYPYVIIEVEDSKQRFTGVEYQLLQQVASNWNVTYFLPIFVNRTRGNVFIDELNNNLVDMRMCSVWLTELDYYDYDLSTFHNHECYTLLTPKPVKLSEVTAIYKTFSSYTWITFVLSFFLFGLLLWVSARIQLMEKTVYTDLSRTFLEVTNIATSHGVDKFPRQYSMNILLLSWILLCLWLGICYTTIYTSLLTSPGYTKIIDSIEDFLENGS